MASNNSYIYNETASGVVNGVNKVFTVSNTIATIESLRIGYVEYTNFIYSGNTITLNDAPTVINGGVFVDYFYSSTTTTFDSVNLIYDETLSGAVDGVNKVFYSVYPIGSIEELRIGGIIYTSFTVNGRAVTLATAPSTVNGAPHLDYFRSDASVNSINSGISLQDLRSSIYTRIGQTVTSLQFPKSLADEYILEGIVRVSKMKRDRVKRSILSFHKAFDTSIISTDLNTINVGTTSKYLPGKGIAIVDNGNVIYYNKKTSSSITSLSGLTLNDIVDSKIQFGYKLSRTIDKISEVFVDGFKLTPCDFAEYMSNNRSFGDKFMVYNDYLFLPFAPTDGNVITVVYIGKNTSTYSETDIIDFNGDYISVIKSYVMWNMYKDREDDRFRNEYQNYLQIIKEYKRELSKQYETTSAVMQYGGPSIG